MTSFVAKVRYDDDTDISSPIELLGELQITASDITYLSQLPDSELRMHHGVGPEFAAILVAIQAGVWEYAVEKALDGLVKLIKGKWFEKASKKATEAEERIRHQPATNGYTKARLAQINSRGQIGAKDRFPYSLMNISISESGKRWIQVLFPYPMTDEQADVAVATLREILDRVEPSSSGILVFNKNSGKWDAQGAIKLSGQEPINAQ